MPCWVKTVARQNGKFAKKCDDGQELDLLGLYCYDKCSSGYKPVGGDCFEAECPKGFLDWGTSCQKKDVSLSCPKGTSSILGLGCTKKHYDRKSASKARCPPGQELDKLLNTCYDKCPEHSNGLAALCVGSCPNGLEMCGAGLCLPKG